MKSHMHSRGQVGGRVNPQQIIFELKHRVVLAMNKLADRDTYQIGAEELERIAEGLTPEGVVPFLSCVIETNSEQKSTVRKECVRIMGTLAKFHGGLLGPHLGKMTGSIVKRLKDQDSAVKDACVETVGVLASKMCNCGGQSDGPFVTLVKPLFEARGEQNKQVQSGSALCLARVIDSANNPPEALLQRILTRIIKLLKNQHFMAKPALIELIRSIIQAGGASTEHALAAAIHSIQETLKSNDWTTRKAASVALAGIATIGGSLLASFKASCILSLESCRFDKVKPVRDSVMQAIQYWKSLPGSDYPEPSEAGSSTKENFCGGDYDLTSASEGGWKDNPIGKGSSHCAVNGIAASSTKKRSPLAVRKTCPNYVQSPRHPKTDDWHIEIALPKTLTVSLGDAQNEESEGSCVTKGFERTNADANRVQGAAYDFMQMDDKPESSSMSDIVSSSFETKEMTVAHNSFEVNDSLKGMGMNHRPSTGEIETGGHINLQRMQGRSSLDSTVTDLSSRGLHGCCSHSNELAFIRQKLLEIESKQSNLLDLVQVFMSSTMDGLSSTMDGLSMLQSKVLGLEHMVDKIAHELTGSGNHSNISCFKHFKNSLSVSSSPRLSNCSPRPSVDTNHRPSSFSVKSRELWEETAFTKSRSSTSVKQGVELWRDPTLNISRNPMAKVSQKNVGHGAQSKGNCQSRKVEDCSALSCTANAKQHNLESKNNLRKRIKNFLCTGDLEAAFVEALCSGDGLVLVELMDRTGPVLERLSQETASEILGTVVVHLLEQRFLDSILPWLHQVVNLSTTREIECLVSPTAKKEVLSAIQAAAAMNFSDPATRRSITQLALKLHLIWGEREAVVKIAFEELHAPQQKITGGLS